MSGGARRWLSLQAWLQPSRLEAMTIAIEKMSWEEKLRTLEELWDSITREGDRYHSPNWHEQALKETKQRCESGAEQSADWIRAKRELYRLRGG